MTGESAVPEREAHAPKAEQPEVFWPGTTIRKSLNNGFTLGFLGVPHGFDPSTPAAPAKVPSRNPRALLAFNHLHGAIPGMGEHQ